MANMRYFSDLPDGRTVEVLRDLHGAEKAKIAEHFPALYASGKCRHYDSFTILAGKSAEGKLYPVTRSIEFKRNPSLHKCDARCQHAKGHDCECSCGGKNHGLHA